MNGPFEAALFDLDGTLVDSSPLHERAFLETIAEAGVALDRPFRYGDVLGRATDDVFRDLGIADELLVAELSSAKRGRYRRLVDTAPLSAMPGARALLERLRADGVRTFVVSSGSTKSVASALAASGLSPLLDGVVTADDVLAAKPDPEPYLACLARFGIRAGRAVAVEDAPAGVVSARAAGLTVFGVFTSELRDLADAYADDFAGLARLFEVGATA